jgi:four helix bundle protein
LFIRLHKISRTEFPSYERYELCAQVRRAAYSVAANIVEGLARRQFRDKLHFLNISESSLAEVAYCVHVAERLEYITTAIARDLQREIKQVNAPLLGLMRFDSRGS